jgi:hypothetical protein
MRVLSGTKLVENYNFYRFSRAQPECLYVTVIFYFEKGKVFIEVCCAELFLDMCNFSLKEILNANIPAAPTGKMYSEKVKLSLCLTK